VFPLPGNFWTEATPITVLLFILLYLITAIIKGWLRSNRAVQEVRADRDARLAECHQVTEDWKMACAAKDDALRIQQDIAREALEVSRVNEDVIRSLRVALDMIRKDGTL
jgi:hypothetical protein